MFENYIRCYEDRKGDSYREVRSISTILPPILPIIIPQDEEAIREYYKRVIKERLDPLRDQMKHEVVVYEENIALYNKDRRRRRNKRKALYALEQLKKAKKLYTHFSATDEFIDAQMRKFHSLQGIISIFPKGRWPHFRICAELAPIVVIESWHDDRSTVLGRYLIALGHDIPMPRIIRMGHERDYHIHPHISASLVCRGSFASYMDTRRRNYDLAGEMALMVQYLGRYDAGDVISMLLNYRTDTNLIYKGPCCSKSHRKEIPHVFRCMDPTCNKSA